MATEVQPIQFNNITLGGSIGGSQGTFKISTNGIAWKSKGEGLRTVTVPASEIQNVQWIRIGRFFQLKFDTINGSQSKFDGFREQDHANISSMIKDSFKIKLETVEVSTKGVNWGNPIFQGQFLSFTVEGKPALEIPLAMVSQTTHLKNEVTLEFHQDDTATPETESLTEMKFFFQSGGDDMGPETFHKKIIEKADFIAQAGTGAVTLPNVHILTPRGRFDLEMYPQFMKLHGKTRTFKILYSSISRLFQLPKPDGSHVTFVVSVEPPIRHGSTSYPHLLLHFDKSDQMDVTVNLPKEVLEKKYNNKLKPTMSGPSEVIVKKIFKAMTGKKLTAPSTFKSHYGVKAVRCSLKANEGFVYPLEKSFFCIHKSPMHIPFSAIASVEFSRVSSGASTANSTTRTFDLVITLKNNGPVHVFTNIQRQEYSNLFNFLSVRKLRINGSVSGTIIEERKSVEDEEMNTSIVKSQLDEDEEEDDDFVADEGDDIPEE
eukprot:TRINITY_DN245_c0_g1_i1.p1 TRINITY_DN245_c0_g1~~TRINITY_DN245_c0_g1_i1.p1  ORF type:complete len:489 (-),score=116.00 TRINITY_DN245_c0_g1_i1:436-1902(-)